MKLRRKLHAFLLGVSCANSLLLGCRISQDPQKIPVVVDSSSFPGVEIIVPGEPRFDQEARRIVGAKLDLVKTLSPLLMLIKNDSKHTIVAFSPEWDLKLGGEEIPYVGLRTYPMAISGPECGFPRDRDIRPGEEWLVGLDNDFGSRIDEAGGSDVDFSETAKNQKRELLGVISVRAHLDAVIFDDGALVGPDRHNLSRKFAPYVEDHQALYRSILASLHSGESGERLYHGLEQKRRQEFNEVTHSSLPWDSTKTAQLIAEQDVLGAWQNHDDRDSVEHFSLCLRTPPFEVTRKN